ncbi:hypothetical protein [Ferrimonas sp. YFM]|uniref:hypothetical protein n=1 Tax=Ferrimonas sp. YFM TaxID=3028878 RepID=UPI00257407FE|nr:hypothetical protein [Ferrimonas sp. YFM]BDY06003.1 hypothetical protein F0521_30440 [Ferrimonas sp. YFM]
MRTANNELLRQTLRQVMKLLQQVPQDQPGQVKVLQDKYLDTLCEQLGMDLNPTQFVDSGYSFTDAGKAVSPLVAAMCAKEYMRVHQFQLGILKAINERSQPVRVLYAGTGPLGSLVLPLLLLLKPGQVRVTLLDIHQESLDSLKQILDLLNLWDFIDDLILADAIHWQTESRFDLIVSETMKAMLEQEPQVRIFANLEQFLSPDGSLIPRAIELRAYFYQRQGRHLAVTDLGPFFVLNRETAELLRECQQIQGQLRFPVNGVAERLELHTRIQIYDDIELSGRQCSLNRIECIPLNEALPSSAFDFRYAWGPEPRFEFTPVDLPNTAIGVR